MATTFLTSAERDSYSQIPELEEEEFIQAYYLTKTDKAFLTTFTGVVNRYSIAIQVCLIRYFGFLEDSWKNQLDNDIAEFIASQLGYSQAPLRLLEEYGNRPNTRSTGVVKHFGDFLHSVHLTQ